MLTPKKYNNEETKEREVKIQNIGSDDMPEITENKITLALKIITNKTAPDPMAYSEKCWRMKWGKLASRGRRK